MSDLNTELDEAAARLLKKIGATDTVASEGPSVLLVDQVKVFEAIVNWVKVRKTVAADETPQETKLDGLRNKFHGASPRRRGNRSAAEAAEPASGVGPAAAPSPGPNGHALFDA